MKEGSPLGLDELVKNDLLLPDELIPEMRIPLGRLEKGEVPVEELSDGKMIVTVGDECTLNLIRKGVKPDLAIVDYKTKREELANTPEINGFGDTVLKLKNPAGGISKEAWTVLKDAFEAGRSVRIDVDGEEDLLALPSIILAPPSTTVLYGLPSHGLVVVDIDDKVRQKAVDLVKRMVVESGD
ncbi:MAG: DUF359 domain-containing protein [Thermoplasmata archaeon]|nr:DUF359 domain-containing protein [Thermoplasmata archaeon]